MMMKVTRRPRKSVLLLRKVLLQLTREFANGSNRGSGFFFIGRQCGVISIVIEFTLLYAVTLAVFVFLRPLKQ